MLTDAPPNEPISVYAVVVPAYGELPGTVLRRYTSNRVNGEMNGVLATPFCTRLIVNDVGVPVVALASVAGGVVTAVDETLVVYVMDALSGPCAPPKNVGTVVCAAELSSV